MMNLLVVAPGMTRTVEVIQQKLFPGGCPQFFVFVLGSGTLGVSVKKDDAAGVAIFMAGAAFTHSGTVPLCRIGLSEGMIGQIIEIGSHDVPWGFVWLYCGVVLAQNLPPYTYQVRFSLVQ